MLRMREEVKSSNVVVLRFLCFFRRRNFFTIYFPSFYYFVHSVSILHYLNLSFRGSFYMYLMITTTLSQI